MTAVVFAQTSAPDRIKIFEKVWGTISEKYYDPHFNGVDWSKLRDFYKPRVEAAKSDDEFYTTIKQMVGELGDIHTSFHAPREVEADKRNVKIGVGLWLGEAEGKTVIFGVEPDTDAARAGIRSGMIVNKIDGRETAEILTEKRAAIKSSSTNAVNRKAFAQLLSGAANTSVRLSLSEPNDTAAREVMLVRRVLNSPKEAETLFNSRRMPSDVGYIRFDEFDFKVLKNSKRQ
jgi:C-terminal processing protease CtpA/Prc